MIYPSTKKKDPKIRELTRRNININMIINEGVGIYLKEN